MTPGNKISVKVLQKESWCSSRLRQIIGCWTGPIPLFKGIMSQSLLTTRVGVFQSMKSTYLRFYGKFIRSRYVEEIFINIQGTIRIHGSKSCASAIGEHGRRVSHHTMTEDPDFTWWRQLSAVDRMYRICLVFVAATAAAQNPYDLESRAVTLSGKPTLGPLYTSALGGGQGFRDNSYEDNAVTPTPSSAPIYRTPNNQPLYRKPTNDGSRDYQSSVRVGGGPPRGPLRGPIGPNGPLNAEELEEEKEEPDRLTLLLPQSKFDCVGKQTGYYADEDLNCEVFHYCHENAKHSWICPEGFTFHQVHLICMPPSGDISCKKSSQYHFVNEYLYKPLNLAEAETKPNVTLRYSERYYPSDIYTDEREAGDYQIPPTASPPIRRPLQQVFVGHQPATLNSIPPSARPQIQLPQFRLPANQVFHSPEEVNIPLQHRRPQQSQQQQQQQQQQQHQAIRRFPQVRPQEEDYE
ncbi:hypothetical protein KPH14_005578 [Odynerus spinipes]|uniref:Chitin-binding type-2 domain-containing protein n=1 Tax=Odynerus spinipes TaxID=1348599 RepID=A0AAD9RAK6_9HYME|nr:hypothetical protein KPH14_005578 [Odynerus spinipes]